ncbi:MAG: 2-phosphosulfolactate phosphatase, partial [Synergistaceae bacterium]|nr:2-phosphosulfolactate phosphatase [Synergistaceae bacterium]
MNISVDVVLSQSEPLTCEADIWLVIDILRATSVISRWFELGGKIIYPVIEPEDA